MAEPMSAERLARLRMDNEPIGDHLSGLTADEVGELLDEVERLRQENAQLYGHLTAEMEISKEAARRLEEATRERNELRAQLAEIGETREEWTIERRWRDGMVTQTKTWTDEVIARANLAYEPADDFHWEVQVSAKPHLMRRLAGDWRQVEQEADRG